MQEASVYQKYQIRLNDFQKLPNWTNSESKTIFLRKKLRSKKYESHRISTSSFSIKKFSNYAPEIIPEIPSIILQLFTNLNRYSSPTEIITEITNAVKSNCNLESCLTFINSILLSPNPTFITITTSGLISELLEILNENASLTLFSLAADCLCNLAAGPKECTASIRKAEGMLQLLKILDFPLECDQTSIIIKILRNLIDCYQGFYDFYQKGGLEKVSDTINKWRNCRIVCKEIVYFAVVIVEFIKELNSIEINSLMLWIEILIEQSDIETEKECLWVIELLCETNPEEFKIAFIHFAAKYFFNSDASKALLSLHILGNIACKNPKMITIDIFILIFNRINWFIYPKVLKERYLWMIRCFIVNNNNAEVLYSHANLQLVSNLLFDSEIKVRKNTIKLFKQLFASDYFNRSNKFIPLFVMNGIYEGLESCDIIEITRMYLELIDLIIQMNENLYLRQSLESTSIIDKLEELVFHKNDELSYFAQCLLESLQDLNNACT